LKVILKEDVYNQGVAGEVVDVADGYARNYLIPQGFAMKATPGTLKQAEKLRKAAAARRAHVYNELQGIAEQIAEVELFFAVKAGTTGKLYGSVTMGDIADALQRDIGLEIDRRRIGEGQSLRELGEHMVPVRLGSNLTPRVRVVIHREGESPEAAIEEAKALLEEEEAAMAEAAEYVAAEVIASEEGEEAEEPSAATAEPESSAPTDGGE